MAISTTLDITTLKEFLAIEPEFTDNDNLLNNCLEAAKIAVAKYIGGTDDITSDAYLDMAILQLAAHLYTNRNIVNFGAAAEMPYTFRFILDYYKDWVIS